MGSRKRCGRKQRNGEKEDLCPFVVKEECISIRKTRLERTDETIRSLLERLEQMPLVGRRDVDSERSSEGSVTLPLCTNY
jgi:hypothetical protein